MVHKAEIVVPEVVRKRTNALRNLQLKIKEAGIKLSEESFKLECKYAKILEPIYVQREKIINGEYEPTEEEATWNYQCGCDQCPDLSLGAEADGSATKKQKTGNEQDICGLPDFWLQVLKENNLVSGLISEYDEPVLRFLRDIRVKLTDSPMGYIIEFHFNENDFFTNSVLSKTYELNTQPNKDNPFCNKLQPLTRCVGTEINWKEGKNVIFNIQQKQTGSGSSSKKKEDEEEEDEEGSFFTLFETRTEGGINPLVSGQVNPENITILPSLMQEFEMDFEVGNVIKDVIVPNAVLIYTGELEDEEVENTFDDDDEDDEDDDDDDDEEEEEEELPKKKKSSQ